MTFMKTSMIKKRARELKELIQQNCGKRATVSVGKGFSEVGGGSLPAEVLPTYLVMISINGLKPKKVLELLRNHHPPIIARIEHDEVIMDPRTLFSDDIQEIGEACGTICKNR